MRRHRTVYFNDARHYYLFVFEPPMRLEDAWRPVDEAAGTAVDTFIYGVERTDGLFYPSKVGLRFGADRGPFKDAYEWRVWYNMQSLIDRGLDPLTVLIDRAHQKGMDFFASLRMGGYGGMAPEHALATGGRGYVHPEVRDHVFAVLEELATQYPVEGVELDFAAAPGGSPFWLRPEDVPEYTPVMTDFVRRVATMVRNRPGGPGQVGARVYPTEALNRKAGLNVRAWLQEGLVDFVVPLVYASFTLDANMPIGWLVETAHEHEIAVYGMLQPYYHDGSRRFYPTTNATPAMMRASAANGWALDVDGLYTWFLRWPLGDAERRILTELGDPDLVKEEDKHYFLRRRPEEIQEHDYEAFLPLSIPSANADARHPIPFFIADETRNDRIRRIQLRIGVSNSVSADVLDVWLNGQSLAAERGTRAAIRSLDPYSGLWLEFDLDRVRPQQGQNLLELSLRGRPPGLEGGITVEDVEVIVEYGTYPATGH
ncbi:MAG: hypothetical protein HY710_10795 [Candidatus Latescibacteria bacterium]|nr:hypothetical protein [Candidatus Latescibacterota bacterium]